MTDQLFQAFTDDDLDILESSLVGEAQLRSRRTSVPSKTQTQLVDDEIADIFYDDEEIAGSKSMMIVKAYDDDDSDIVDMAKKRKFNSFRSEKSRSSLGDIAETKIVKEFKAKSNKATALPPNHAHSGAEENSRQSFFMNLQGILQFGRRNNS